ncbi:hypothetical protein FRC03_012184, partial [Tulasnella sp. 419]
ETEDWEDLKELFGNALDTFEGENPSSSAPLLRGVIHECDRFQRHQTNPTDVYLSSSDGSTSKSASDPPAAFYAIHGTSLYLLGTLISQDPSLLSQGEPEEPAEFFKAAIIVFESSPADVPSIAATGYWQSWLHFIWGQTALANLGDADSEEHAAAINSALDSASKHLLASVESLPSQTEDPEDREPWYLSRSKALAEAAVMFFAAAETADAESRSKWCKWLTETFLKETEKEDEGSISMKLAILKIRGRCWLTLASDYAEEVEEMFNREEEDDDEIWKSSSVTKGRDLVNKALDAFKAARELVPTSESEGNDPEDQELLKLYGESLLTLANLTQDPDEREQLYKKVKDETGIDPEGDDEGDDEDEDIQ